ncbi:hypothetical protein SCAR479_03293 [Seiridium cardinale]|uniref:Uncharacterized protein n=1 Tax=Seiridium cardinale TaxID=138064 RepID=A0ABR2Y0U8_9PEZI
MALYYRENEESFRDRDEPHDHSRQALVRLWMDKIVLDESADRDLSRNRTREPGRTATSVGHHTRYPETHNGRPAQLAVRSDQPMARDFCYSILGNGVVVVAEGHPFACTCFWNKHLHVGDSAYITPFPVRAPLHTPLRHLDIRQKYLNIIMDCCAIVTYPYHQFKIMTYNPCRLAEKHDLLVFAPLALEPVLTIGATMDMMYNGETIPLNENIASVCRMINETLGSSDGSHHTAVDQQLILHAYFCLATISFTIGDMVSWHTHMESLRHYVDSTKVLNVVDPQEISKMRMADIEDAVFTGLAPRLPYDRIHPLLPCTLPAADVELILTSLRPRLQACSVSSDVSDNIIAACIFIWSLRTSQQHGSEERFDPDNAMEDYHLLQRDLLSSPRPFRDINDIIAFHAQKAVKADRLPQHTDAQFTAGNPYAAFEESLRLTTLMCLRAGIMQGPWSKYAYSALLGLLIERLESILNWISEDLDDCSYIDPALLQTNEQTKSLSVSDCRPFLIWMCLIGFELSVYYGVYHADWSGHHPEKSLYFKLLSALAISTKADADVVSDDDLLIFETLNLNWATGSKRTARDCVKWIVG